MSERESERVSVGVREREREGEKEKACVCVEEKATKLEGCRHSPLFLVVRTSTDSNCTSEIDS